MSDTPSPVSKPRPSSQAWLQTRWQLLSLPMLAFIALPLLALLLRSSPGKVLENLRSPQVVQSMTVSLWTTLVSTGIIILLGTPVASLLARGRGPFRKLLDALIDLPTVLPPAVAGVALLMAFGRRGLLGGLLTEWGIHIAFTSTAVIMAQVFIASPFYIRAATIGFASIDPELEQAAALDGATRWDTFRYVIVPLSWVPLVSGSILSWARAIGEFGATIIFAGNFPGRTQTMPLAIYLGFELDLDIALTLSVILVTFSFLVLLLVKVILQQNQE